MTTAPWHDAPPCPACTTGPLVVADSGTPDPSDPAIRVAFIRCAKCGKRANLDPSKPDDLRTICRVWWSTGAWVGRNDPRTP